MAICKKCKNYMFRETESGLCEKCFIGSDYEKNINEQIRIDEQFKKESRTNFQQFSVYCTVNCNVFIDKLYDCKYDDMEFSATISQRDAFKEALGTTSSNPHLKLYVKMLPINNKPVLLPVMHIECKRKVLPIQRIYIRIGENRFYTDPSSVSTFPLSDGPCDYTDFTLGKKDIEMLKSMTSNKYFVKIRFGDITENIPKTIINEISSYLSVLETAGILEQPEFFDEPDKFHMFTELNGILC